MGSTRLPGKVLADLGGQPLLAYLLRRLAPVPSLATVVATSELGRDDEVAAVASSVGAPVVRGSEGDVLARYLVALDEYPDATHVVRITADCPLTDPAIVDQVVRRHLERGADFTSNVLPRTFPKGLDVEVARATALRTAGREARVAVEREHVMPFLYRHPERFALANVRSGLNLGDLRWTVDTPTDLEVVRTLVARFADRTDFGWREALAADEGGGSPPSGELRLRPAEAADRARLLAWRNDPDAVRFSLSGRSVEAAEHERWLAARLEDPATRLLIGEVDGDPVGMVRVDVEAAVGVVSVAVAPTSRGHGLGTRLLTALLDEFRGDPQVDRLRAEVLDENEASRRAFLAAGFTDDGEQAGVRQFRWENGDT
jgi:spore coat polysaccharide biosynthesis protein SpsF